MRRSARWLGWLGASTCLLALAGLAGVARAAPPSPATPSQRPALKLSTEVQRCLRIGQLPRADREDAQLQCLSSQDESGFVELIRSLAKRRHEKAGYGKERLEYLSWKLREALSKGHEEAAVAVETMLDDAPTHDIELETTALEAMRWVTIARRRAEPPKGHKKGAERPLVAAPRACAERVDAAEPRVAYQAVACVAEAQTGIPIERLIDAALTKPKAWDVWRILKRLRSMPEPQARRLAEALIAKQADEDRVVDDFCETLGNVTPVNAEWATLAGRQAYDKFHTRECDTLARRASPPEPPRLSAAEASAVPVRKRCLEVPDGRQNYVSVCALDLGPAVTDPSRRGVLQVDKSRFGEHSPGQYSQHPWLLGDERLLVDQLSYVTLTEPPRKGEMWEDWDQGLVIVPSVRADGTGRRLHVFGRRASQFRPLWQSPECRQAGCRLDLVARRVSGDGNLLGLVLLSGTQALPLDLKDLLEGSLDQRIGCPRLRPFSLSECSGFAPR